MSAFSDCLKSLKFCVLFEYLTALNSDEMKADFCGFPAFMTLADRVQSDFDPSPLDTAASYAAETVKLLHYSGKGRDISDFEHFLSLVQAQGHTDLLLLSGDKLKQHHDGTAAQPRTRYLESVNQLMAARAYDAKREVFNLGAAFNPFKYAEAERDAQYLKLHKKIQAGADFIISQLGFDLDALKYMQQFMHREYPSIPILACVMPLTWGRAKFMHRQKIAGIVLTDHMLQVLEQEHLQNAEQAKHNAYLRCALQIRICQHWGFAGVHISACHKASEQLLLEQVLASNADLSLDECWEKWMRLWQISDINDLKPKVPLYSKPVSVGQKLKYRQMHAMHEVFFSSRAAKGVGRFIFKAKLWQHEPAEEALLKTEFISKHSIVGCESCGQCRLGETLYICPETCPKGLANGPCGGSSLDRCEFGDRECIHSVKARLAKAVNQTEILKTALIPAVALETRDTSSWKNWFSAKVSA